MQFAANGDHTALVGVSRTRLDMRLQQQVARAHQREHRLPVQGLRSGGPAHAVQQDGNPPVAVGGRCVSELADGGPELVITWRR